MSEHGTWFDFIRFKFHGLDEWLHHLGEIEIGGTTLARKKPFAMLFQESHWDLNHVFFAILVLLIVFFGALAFKRQVGNGDKGLVPPAKVTGRNFFESIADATFGLMVNVMGEKQAKRFLPFIGSLAVFILFSNLFALIPTFGVPSATLKTNIVLALLVFLVTHYAGFKEHGIAYLKHFMGPLLVLAPLMFVIEMISHLARPASLALRLMGNMAADHKVVFTFFTLVPLLIPVPFLLLGILVCVVQTLVFCLLSMVYISMAVSHDH